MQCPHCGNDMAPLAVACPNCGQPGFGSFLNQNQPVLTPKEQAEVLEAAGGCIAFLLKWGLIFGSVGVVMCAVAVGLASALESPLVISIVHGGIVCLKWLALTAIAFLPFGIITGLITNSTQGVFLDGYLWGQLTGPVGLIVAIFQIPDKNQPGTTFSQPATASRDNSPRHKVVKTKGFEVLIRFICPHCEKRYKVEESALGKKFTCGGCGHSSIVTRHIKNSSSSGD